MRRIRPRMTGKSGHGKGPLEMQTPSAYECGADGTSPQVRLWGEVMGDKLLPSCFHWVRVCLG